MDGTGVPYASVDEAPRQPDGRWAAAEWPGRSMSCGLNFHEQCGRDWCQCSCHEGR